MNVRSPEEQFTELEEFYNMTNREVFEKYGINAQDEASKMLLSNSLLLDSLLKGKYDEVDTIFCGRLDNNVFKTNIHMQDGTDIIAGDTEGDRGIRIEKDGKVARLEYDPASKKGTSVVISDINNLTIENLKYSGDTNLMKQIERAIEEQFGIRDEIANENADDMNTQKSDFEDKQVIARKILQTLDSYKNGKDEPQSIENIQEFDLLQKLLQEEIWLSGSVGYYKSSVTTDIPNWYTSVPTNQYHFIQLLDSKRVHIQFSANENKGKITIKDFGKMIEPTDSSDFISTRSEISEEQLRECLEKYITKDDIDQQQKKEPISEDVDDDFNQDI